MVYENQILSWLIDSYEKKDPTSSHSRKAAITLSKKYPEYREPLSQTHDELESAIQHMLSWGFIQCSKDQQGYYTKITLDDSAIASIYKYLKRVPLADLRKQQAEILEKYAAPTDCITGRFCSSMLRRISENKDLEYGLSKDLRLLEDVLLALKHLEALTKETYLRNFSEMVFHDSKRLQSISGQLSKILMDYGDGIGQKDTILAQYNLISNPGYVYIKGDWEITCQDHSLSVRMFHGGIALSSDALAEIDHISVPVKRIISVENLTTYHDTNEHQGAVIYLGGFMNTVRANLLKKVFASEPHARYYHHGDLDPYGFLILENLKTKTGIPFEPLEMDLPTLRRCHLAGHFRPLDESDQKLIGNPLLHTYQPILQYMLEHNCKVEQECFEAMKLEQTILV